MKDEREDERKKDWCQDESVIYARAYAMVRRWVASTLGSRLIGIDVRVDTPSLGPRMVFVSRSVAISDARSVCE